MVACMLASHGGCVLGMGEGRGEVVQGGCGHAVVMGELGGVAQCDGDGLIVRGLSGAVSGQAVVGATGGSIAEVLIG
jgi:hypothetical protein